MKSYEKLHKQNNFQLGISAFNKRNSPSLALAVSCRVEKAGCDTIPDLRRAGVAGYSFSSTNWTILMDIMGNMNTSLSPPIMGLSTVMGL